MEEREAGCFLVKSSVAGVVLVLGEAVYAASKFTVQVSVHKVRLQMIKHDMGLGAALPDPVVTAEFADWPKSIKNIALANSCYTQPQEVACC